MTQANETLAHLGGNKFIAMTDAACFYNGNTLVVKFKGSNIANMMTVSVNANDLYDVTISKQRGLNVKDVENVKGVYAEMLNPMFEKVTGLRVSL